MFNVWRQNILENFEIVGEDTGSALSLVVSGSEIDREFWRRHFARTARDIFRRSGRLSLHSICEGEAKGNFLGTLNAWASVGQAETGDGARPDVALISMVFGQGKRLSPFTQSLGNRKAAFNVPIKASGSDVYLNTADLSNLHSNNWLRHLGRSGFRGVLVKWGDEAVIPGRLWRHEAHDFSDLDAVRFVWETEMTEALAREKEWFIIDRESGLILFELPRQGIESMQGRLREFAGRPFGLGVNLGSIAVSYDFLSTALEVLGGDVATPRLSADWDPYVWLALFCRDEEQWRAEKRHEASIGKSGIEQLEARYPHFYQKLSRLRAALEHRKGRPLKVGALNFGEAFWVDIGLHQSLRRCFESLTNDTDEGRAVRELFRLPHERDPNGNVVVNSLIPAGADIRDSVIVDSVILDDSTLLRGGVVVAGRHRTVRMPDGGAALFCAVDQLSFSGPRGVAFRSLGEQVNLPEGGRHTTVFLPQGPAGMVSNEAVVSYDGDTFNKPLAGNPVSFAEAAALMAGVDGVKLEQMWHNAWQNRLAAQP